MSEAAALRERIAKGEVRMSELAASVHKRIAERDPEIHAWAHFDPDALHRGAGALEAYRQSGRPLPSLFGMPVGIKDILDVEGMPTGYGLKGRTPAIASSDSTISGRLRQAGALIAGKTVTTELAYFEPRETRNPHNPAHTPGGSSSGSAAAVADGHVIAAIGTQTNGSMIRPASYCGVIGFKPSHGIIPRTGGLLHHPLLDTPGIFARTIGDIALVADALAGADGQDRSVSWAPNGRFYETALSQPPLPPRLAIVPTPFWGEASDDVREAFGELGEALGSQAMVVDLPSPFDKAAIALNRIMKRGFAENIPALLPDAGAFMGEIMRASIAEGAAVSDSELEEALAWRRAMIAILPELYKQCDAILTPAAPGEAPEGLGATGNPIFCTTWSLTGSPAISLPLMTGSKGLPIGLQMVGLPGDDARLLRNANWLMQHLANG